MNRILIALAVAVVLPAIAADAPPVSIERAVESPIVRLVPVNGTVTSPRTAILSSSVGGLIAQMDIDAGDHVEAGDVIVRLDDELEVLELRRREAGLAEARVTLADTRRRLDEAERVRSASAIPESEIKSLIAAVERGSAALAAAEAAVRQQQAVVARHTVRAPFRGVVGERIAEIGEWVNPGSGLIELVATEGLRFDFRVPQQYYADIDPETQVQLESDAVPGFRAEGRIGAIVPIKDPGARTFLLRVVVEGDPGRAVTPGMSARGIIRIDTGRSGVVVPRDALLRYPDGREVVWIIDETAELPSVTQRQVETGIMFEGKVEIMSGVTAGAAVVTRGNEALQQGQTVTIR